jgi:uncharacterized lipoprotein YehR (DUF1307 family)
MKKNVIRLLCVALAVITVGALFACSDDKAKEIEALSSGTELELDEDILEIEESFKLKSEKDGYIPGANIKITVSGYPKLLSYFDGKVIFIWKYEYLNDSGKYVPATEKVTVDLDASGKGSYKETVEFKGARSVKDIELTIEYKGFAVRK